ncbi:hypothetical protein CAPTEDRAFT_220722 [Capitella teleta]|uniref:Uncharacterized protein n=1 Tax=Capitella teleta TaxID=283909 RepID=R7U9A9_CAPTE|nr:hypothetical protein CAPTEDRAFT_220722 [Capitella teleta]|eukprot:ELU02915.1 hypothetical protein CAPTEDRAFT_220722 [Capitella teleta]
MTSRRKKGCETISLTIPFEGLLSTTVRADLLREFVKYIFFQRQQIPIPFDHMKEDADDSNRQLPPGPVSIKPSKKRESLKRHKCVLSLTEIFSTLNHIFLTAGPVTQVLFILGSTIVSPRDVYLINLPSYSYETRELSSRQCLAALFKRVVGSDWYSSVPELKSLTKLHVLVRTNTSFRCDDLPLIPRPNFRVPQRGHHFTLNLICGPSNFDPNLSQIEAEDDAFDISGIESLNFSDLAEPQGSRLGSAIEPSGDIETSLDDSGMDEEENSSEQMWYQMTIAAKGYRDVSSKTAEPNYM